MGSNKKTLNNGLYNLVKAAYIQMLYSVDETIAAKTHSLIELGMDMDRAREKALIYYQDLILNDSSQEMKIIHKYKILMTDFGEKIDDEEQMEASINNLANALALYDTNILDKFESPDKFTECIRKKLLIREVIERLKPFDEVTEPPQKYFTDIFVKNDFEKYIDVLTTCTPPLLAKNEKKYQFVGNKNIHIGCVGQWFNFLKSEGIISPSASRYLIAEVLNSEIENLYISHASIENISNRYNKIFEKQLADAYRKV